MRDLKNWRLWIIAALFLAGLLFLGGEADSMRGQLIASAIGFVLLGGSIVLGRRWDEFIYDEEDYEDD